MQATITPHTDSGPRSDTATESSGAVDFRYQTVRTSRMTFEAEKIREWVKGAIPAGEDITVLNACAGETKLADEIEAEVIRNDINPDVDADLHVDVATLGEHIESNSVDVVIHDPPYSEQQSADTYGTGEKTRYGEATLSQFRQVLNPGGTLIQWGYSPILNDGFEIDDVVLWNRIGRGHDFVATVQTYRPDDDTAGENIDASATVPFNPRIAGVTGGASFGGNDGCDIEMSILGDASTPPETQVLVEVARLKQGVTLVVTDTPRIHSPIDDHDTAIISVVEDAGAHNHIGVRELSDRLPSGVIDTVVVDLETDAYCWNCYYEPDAEWEETNEQTGYVTALKREAAKLLTDTGRLIQIGQTATNAPSGTDFERTHVALTATAEQTIAPFVTVDQRCGTDAEPSASDDLLWPMRHLNNERTRPSSFRYESSKEGMHHHPAVGVRCPECGAGRANLCISDDGSSAPSGSYHESRVEKGEEQFYGEGTLLSISEYLRHRWFESPTTDPARPKTAGGVNKTPPAAKDDNQAEGEQTPDDSAGDEATVTLAHFQ